MSKKQLDICEKYNADFFPAKQDEKIGIADNVFSGILPINGLRHYPENGTTGWYIYAGEEMSKEDNYFKPLHVFHLKEKFPQLLDYLGLPPGWRFLIADDYEDVWFDENLLEK